jgi:GTP cyclohydrolase III
MKTKNGLNLPGSIESVSKKYRRLLNVTMRLCVEAGKTFEEAERQNAIIAIAEEEDRKQEVLRLKLTNGDLRQQYYD